MVVQIKGVFEYDDDDLTPGKKKEGGLHQNLYDAEGNLTSSARFIPDPDQDEAPTFYETVYIEVPVESSERSREDEEFEEQLKSLVAALLAIGIIKATPVVRQWWSDRAAPAIEDRRAALERRRSARRQRKAAKALGTASSVTDQVATTAPETTTNMSRAEALTRYLRARLARAYSDEQIRVLQHANIQDQDAWAKLTQMLAELPPQQVAQILAALEANPSLLDGEHQRELERLLGSSPAPPDRIPIDRAPREQRDRRP
jgi:hypothetical protein